MLTTRHPLPSHQYQMQLPLSGGLQMDTMHPAGLQVPLLFRPPPPGPLRAGLAFAWFASASAKACEQTLSLAHVLVAEVVSAANATPLIAKPTRKDAKHVIFMEVSRCRTAPAFLAKRPSFARIASDTITPPLADMEVDLRP